MNILFAISELRDGGAERVVSILANNLCLENNVHIVVVNEGINYEINDRVHYSLLKGEHSRKLLRIFKRLYGFARKLKEIQPDVIISFSNNISVYVALSMQISNTTNVKLIASERTDPTREPVSDIAKKLRNWAYSRADVLVCQTEWVASYFKKRNIKAIELIPNPLTPDLPMWEGINSKIILTACRLEKQKNLPLLISAFSLFHQKHPETVLYIYGEGSEKKELQQMSSRLGLENVIQFKGFSKDIFNIMSSSYMYVSTSDYEGISNSMLESLGIGVPTICTDCPVGGAKMAIEDGINGILTPVGDVNYIADKMDTLYKDKTFAQTISHNAIASMNRFDVIDIVGKWLSLIKK